MDSSNNNNISVDLESSDDEISILELEKSNTNKAKRKVSKRSMVWKFFDEVFEGEEPNKTKRAAWKAYGQSYVADGKYGTGNMRKHIKVCPKNISRDVGQILLGGSSGSGSLAVLSNKFDHDKLRELIVYAIIMHDLSFQFVEYEGFRSILQYLRPEVQFVFRNTIKSDCMKIYKKEKAIMKSLLHAALGRISITSDLWSSLTSDGYMSLTTHFIDKNWKLQKRVLNFSYLPPRHTGIAFPDVISTLLLEWDIQGKIFGITLDNASANDVSAKELRIHLNTKGLLVCGGDFFHLKCCAHILNLIVQDGLKEIESYIEKIRESVKYVKGSQVRRQKFVECVRLISIGGQRGLNQDVATRWNSIYLMLDSALFYRWVFQHLALVDFNYKKYPSSEEWERVEKIYKFLKVFYEATLTFSRNTYPTSSLYFPVVIYCYEILKDALDGGDDYMKSMATKMWVKFQKYWAAFSDTLAIACIFDPRYKLQFIDFVYNKIYGLESFELLTLHGKIDDLYAKYATKFGRIGQFGSSPLQHKAKRSKTNNNNSSSGGIDVDCSFLKEFDDVSCESVPTIKSQLQLYFEDQRLSRFDAIYILAFWNTNQYWFPIVAAMARDISAVHVSTVASKFAFSVGSRVLDQFRTSFKPDTVEAIICTRDWLFGEKTGGTKNIDEDIDKLTQDVIEQASNVDHSNEGEGSSHAM